MNRLPTRNVSELLAALKECSVSRNLQRGRRIHETIFRDGHDSCVSIMNSLIYMYSKCGSVYEAQNLFGKMENRTIVSWNTMILGYAENGVAETSLTLFGTMKVQNVMPDDRTFVAVLKACNGLDMEYENIIKALHLLASCTSYDSDIFVANTLLDMYTKCGNIEVALKVFHNMEFRTMVSWTALILGYADMGYGEVALDLFAQMLHDGFSPDAKCIVAVLKGCSNFATKEEPNCTKERGGALHLLALRNGCQLNFYLGTSLISLYAKCGDTKNACKIFETMQFHTVLSWNALMSGYGDNNKAVIDLFSRMRSEGYSPNAATFLAVLKSCNELELIKAVHMLACSTGEDSNSFLEFRLMDFYIKYKSMKNAQIVFDCIRNPDVTSWTALILGYVENGKPEIALNQFAVMKKQGCSPDSTAFYAALKACTVLGALEVGKEIHAEICSRGYVKDEVLASTLVHFYAKCGSMLEAQQVFNHATERDLVPSTALMAGYTRLGDSQGVFNLLTRMVDAGVTPDAVVFVLVLTACSHAGLVDKGMECFRIMSTRYGIVPELKHYTCVVDMLGRANKLDDAMVLVRSMPYTSDEVIWLTLLGACRKWKNVCLGSLAFESLSCLDDKNSEGYIMLAELEC